MVDVDRFRPEDRRALDGMYRRVFGNDAAESSRLRWNWQYLSNPSTPAGGPQIWVAREGPTLVGQYATMPVRLSLRGREIAGSWGMDVMVAPERQRRGLGEILFRTWDRNVGASLGLGLSDSSYRLFKKLQWPDVGPVPCLIKPLTRRGVAQPGWPAPINGLVSAAALPFVKLLGSSGAPPPEVTEVRRFDDAVTRLWERVAPKFDLAVRRDAAYLNWKYASPPHVRYSIAVLRGAADTRGYAVYRHLQEPRGRVTLLVDFLTDPDDTAALQVLLRWVDLAARAERSDKIRTFAMHEGYTRALRRWGYFRVKSTMEFVAKINAVDVAPGFYEKTGRWHVTLGDSDQDR
jgi:hypothetical protein